MSVRKKYKWEITHVPYSEWSQATDWSNYYKVNRTVRDYIFRIEMYKEGMVNEFIFKSTFGIKDKIDVKKEINKLFDKCIGAYSEIEFN